MTFARKDFRVFGAADLEHFGPLRELPPEDLLARRAVAAVLPFRANNHVIDELIDWDRIPEDPIFQLSFPQPGMLPADDLREMMDLLRREAPQEQVATAARRIQLSLNPHPAGQLELNVPRQGGEPLAGLQHKYRETVLFFPSQGQTCHAYCTYCFRWPQFVGLDEMKCAGREAEVLVGYLDEHPEVTDVLLTGGDPLVMRTRVLRRYLEPLLRLPQLRTIRIGTKAPAWWPHRFTSDNDADDLMRLFEEVVGAGKHLALMAHFTHPRELEPAAARAALSRIRDTGAVIRCQSPLVRHVNDDSDTWATMWRHQVAVGAVPYYLFVQRDTGARDYFEVPLARALAIYTGATQQVSGIARTVRGPSMSAMPGKVLVDGVVEVGGQKLFALKFLQGRDPSWAGRLFFARYDERAMWLDDLEPAFGEEEFFFERPLDEMCAAAREAGHSAENSWVA